MNTALTNEPQVFLLGALVFVFFLVIISIGLFLYLVYFKFDEIVNCLRRSEIANCKRGFLDCGFVGRVIFVGGVFGVLVFSRRSINKGTLDESDYNEFPAILKLWVLICGYSSAVLALVVCFMNYVGWNR